MEETNQKPINEQDALFIEALKSSNSAVCHQFFYQEIGGTLNKIRIELFRGLVDYDELVDELYLYLSRDQWSKLNGFDGKNGCRLRTWMIPVAWRFFMNAHDRLLCRGHDGCAEADYGDSVHDDLRIQIAIDVNAVLSKMPNRRYAEIIRLLIVEGYAARDVADMLGLKVENVYNLRHRAIAQFIEIYGRR